MFMTKHDNLGATLTRTLRVHTLDPVCKEARMDAGSRMKQPDRQARWD